MKAIFFSSPEEFRKWLERHHDTEQELIVGYYKVHTKKPSMSWSQSVDQALCFGWIDGVRHSIDKDRYQIRFTPRKPDSIWSAVNIKKVQELSEQGLMTEAGLELFRNRKRSKVYAYENRIDTLKPEYLDKFQKNGEAWEYFEALAPSYRKSSIHWVMSAKREETRLKRLDALISESQSGTNRWKDNKYGKR